METTLPSKANEQTFQLIAQVAGRAGRGKNPGRVILQTYAPDHFSIIAARHQDHNAFYTKEIEFRKALNYPPFSRIIQIKISGKDRQRTGMHAELIGELLEAVWRSSKSFLHSIEILGPLEAYVLKIAGKYRWQILLKGKEVKALHIFMHRVMLENTAVFNNHKVLVVVDVDPYFIM
jgi:primosomal protein N' (replication factor Y)